MITSTDSTDLLETLMQSNCLGINDWDTPIYRVFSLCRFKDILIRKKMGLVRPSKWDDPFENFFLKCKVEISGKGLASLKQLCDSWYGQCWTTLQDSDAMWRIYSPNKEGLRVSTTVRKLFRAICDPTEQFANLKFFVGKVEYHEQPEIEAFLRNTTFRDTVLGGQSYPLAKLLCVKRSEFKHEEEVRLLYYDTDHAVDCEVLNIPFDYNTVLEDATLDPRLEENEFERLKEEIRDYGWNLPIGQSGLNRMPEVVIKSG